MNTNRNTIKKRYQFQYVLQLANGKSRCFESASAMAEWMNSERGLEYRRRPNGKGHAGNDRRARRRAAKQASRRNDSPLARYAKRHSDEA